MSEQHKPCDVCNDKGLPLESDQGLGCVVCGRYFPDQQTTPTEPMEPGYYLCVDANNRPYLRYHDSDKWLDESGHWLRTDPRTLGYTIHSVAGLLELQRKCELLCQQNGELLIENHDLKRRLGEHPDTATAKEEG